TCGSRPHTPTVLSPAPRRGDPAWGRGSRVVRASGHRQTRRLSCNPRTCVLARRALVGHALGSSLPRNVGDAWLAAMHGFSPSAMGVVRQPLVRGGIPHRPLSTRPVHRRDVGRAAPTYGVHHETKGLCLLIEENWPSVLRCGNFAFWHLATDHILIGDGRFSERSGH